jgi:hypothetical protein
MLAEWQDRRFAELVGRPPTADDRIVPRDSTGAQHTKSTAGKRAVKELEALGIRKPLQPVHALRATFISLAQEHGAVPDFIRKITHTGKTGRAFDLYSKISWEALCMEVAKLRIDRRDAPPVAQAASRATTKPFRNGRERGVLLQRLLHPKKNPGKIQGLLGGGAGSALLRASRSCRCTAPDWPGAGDRGSVRLY